MRDLLCSSRRSIWNDALVPVLLALVYVAFCFLMQDPTYFPLNGILTDVDSYVRLIQVRDWLNGAGWYDTTVRATVVPYATHWTRVPDLLIAGITKPFVPFVGMNQSLFIAAFLAPLVLLAVLLMIVQGLVRELVPGRHPWAAVLATMCAVSALVVAFTPGQVGHHSYGLLGYASTLWALVYGVRRGFESRALGLVLGGLFTGLMVGATVEMFMGLGVFAGALYGFEIWKNERSVLRTLTLWSLGLTGGITLGVLLARPPTAFFDVFYDRVSVVYVAAAAGGLVLCLLAQHVFSRWGLKARLLGVGLSAGAVATLLIAPFPGLLDPQGYGYDPRVKDYTVQTIPDAMSWVARYGAVRLGLLAAVGGWGGLGLFALKRRSAGAGWLAVLAAPFLIQRLAVACMADPTSINAALSLLVFSLPVLVCLGIAAWMVWRRRSALRGWWLALAISLVFFLGLFVFLQHRVITYLSLLLVPPLAAAFIVGGQEVARCFRTRVWTLGNRRTFSILLMGLFLSSSVFVAEQRSFWRSLPFYPALKAAIYARFQTLNCDSQSLAIPLRDPAFFEGRLPERLAVHDGAGASLTFFAPQKVLALGAFVPSPSVMDMVTLFATNDEDVVKGIVTANRLDAVVLCRPWTKIVFTPGGPNRFMNRLLEGREVPSWLKSHEFPSAPGWVVFTVEPPNAGENGKELGVPGLAPNS